MGDDPVVGALIARFGESAVLVGEAVTSRSAGIWRKDTIQAKAIVRPTSTEEVSAAMAICHEHNQPVIAHGGLTGLVESAITSPDGPAPVGYAQAMEVSDASRWLKISGQIPVRADGTLPSTFADQARQVWANLEAQLTAAEMTLDDLVKVTIFLSDKGTAELFPILYHRAVLENSSHARSNRPTTGGNDHFIKNFI